MSTPPRNLHLGCFDKAIPGWINTDVTPHLFLARVPGLPSLLFKMGLLSQLRYEQHQQKVFHSVRYLDVKKKFPFAADSFDNVYSSHLLEHLYFHQAILCLRETHRVLKKGGLVRIAIPDLDKMVADYDPQHPEPFLESIFEAKQKRDKNRHQWHYNEISLTRLLKDIGFSDPYRCQFQQGRCPDLLLLDNRPASLFMEAVKP